MKKGPPFPHSHWTAQYTVGEDGILAWRTGGQENRRTGGQEDKRTGGQEDRKRGGQEDRRT